jgi:hypothetical protein
LDESTVTVQAAFSRLEDACASQFQKRRRSRQTQRLAPFDRPRDTRVEQRERKHVSGSRRGGSSGRAGRSTRKSNRTGVWGTAHGQHLRVESAAKTRRNNGCRFHLWVLTFERKPWFVAQHGAPAHFVLQGFLRLIGDIRRECYIVLWCCSQRLVKTLSNDLGLERFTSFCREYKEAVDSIMAFMWSASSITIS